ACWIRVDDRARMAVVRHANRYQSIDHQGCRKPRSDDGVRRHFPL
ncbi:MAG: hypothetical protein AVDCRST_MAG87-3591, partial [uncultured Thermomicrobiales bacterium]